LILGAICGGSGAGLAAEAIPDLDWLAGQTAVSFQSYQLQITTRELSNRVTVQAEADLRVTARETDRFYFLLAGYYQAQLEEVKLEGKNVLWRKQADVYWIELPDAKKRGDILTLKMRYSILPKNVSRAVPLELSGGWYPRGLLPEPVQAEMELVAPPGFLGIGNGNLKGIRAYPFQHSGYVWRTLQPVTALAATIGRYQIASRLVRQKAYRVFYLPGLSNSFRDDLVGYAADLGQFYQDKFGAAAFNELSVVVSDLSNEDNCNGSLVLLHLPGNKQSRFVFFNLAHEIAHCWWGNLLYPRSLRDWWLAEGFAGYSGYLAVEHFAPPGTGAAQAARKLLEKWRLDYQKSYQSRRAAQISELSLAELSPYDLQYQLLYHKGAYVLHMVRRTLGEAKFGDYLQEFVKRYGGSGAGIRDFTELGVELYGAQLLEFYRQWVYSSGWYNLALRNVKVRSYQGKYAVSFVMANTGQLYLPETVDFEIITARETFAETLSFKQVNVTIQKMLSAKPKKIILNPRYNILEPAIADNVWTNRFFKR
jgi:hypothetical protein